MSDNRTISPSELRDTEINGLESYRVDQIASSMSRNGYYSSKPIKVYAYNGDYFIIEGHHRKAAAIRVGIDVQITFVTYETMLIYFPDGEAAMMRGKRIKD